MRTYEGYRRLKGAWRPSAAQARVLDEIAAGRSNPQIAAALGLSTETVKWHVAQLLAETGCADRADLACWWRVRSSQPIRGSLLVPWFRLLPRVAATVVALGLGALLLVAGLPAVAKLASYRPLGRLPVAFHRPTDPLPTVTPTPVPRPSPGPGAPFPAQFVWMADGAPDSLRGVRALAVDATGNAYVQEAYRHRVVKLGPDGHRLGDWGGEGEGPGQFQFIYPRGAVAAFAYVGGIAVAPDGTVHVADLSGRVQRFDPDGRYLGEWGRKGSGPGELEMPSSLAIDAAGRVYVVDLDLNRVQVFDRDGALLAGWGRKGVGPGEFDRPSAVTVGPDGTVYVADGFNHRVQRFDASGRYLGQIGGRGRDPGQFEWVGGVAVDAAGTLYVTDGLGGNRIQVFDAAGRYVGEWGGPGSGPGEFARPAEIALDGHGYVYVAEVRNGRIQKFRLP